MRKKHEPEGRKRGDCHRCHLIIRHFFGFVIRISSFFSHRVYIPRAASFRPPSKAVPADPHISSARSPESGVSPMESTLASLCCRERRADSSTPAKCATHTVNFIRHHGFRSRTGEHDAASHSPLATASAAGRIERKFYRVFTECADVFTS